MRIRVLCVDDEPGMLELAKHFLEKRSGFEVDAVSSSEEALERFEGENHDAIVSDYQMPGKDGIQLLREIREKHDHVPFILLTGKGREDVAIEALNSGADFYLQKGMDVDSQFAELANMIKTSVQERRARLKALETSEMLGAVVRSSPVPLIAVDAAGKVFMWNPSAERVFGWTEQETLGRIPPTIPDGSEAEFRSLIDRVLSGERLDGIELRRSRKDGETRYMIGYFAHILGKEGTPAGIMESFVDVTEHRRMEEELKRTNRLYGFLSHTNATIVRAKGQGELIADVCRAAVDYGGFSCAWGSVLDSEGALKPVASSGTDLGELLTLVGGITEQDAKAAPAEKAVREGTTIILTDIESEYSQGRMRDMFKKLNVKSVGAMPIRQGGKTIGALTICSSEPYFSTAEEVHLLDEVSHDVSFALDSIWGEKAKRRAQATLRRESEFTKAVLDTAGAIIVVLDAGGRIVRFNKEAEKVTGWTSDEVHGKPVWDVFIPERLREEVRGVFDQLTAKALPNEHVNPWIIKNGTERIIDWSNTVLKDDEGRPTYVIATGIDVTDRVEAQEELIRTSHDALAAKDRAHTYLDFMTHDIINIITPLSSYSEMMFGGGASDYASRDYAKKMFEQTNRLARFVTHVRKLAHSETDAVKGLESADLRKIINMHEAALRERFKDRSITVAYSVPEGPIMVKGKGYVGDVVNELMENAVRHSASTDVMIDVVIRPMPSEGRGASWQVEIADHGRGIPDEQKRLLLAESLGQKTSATRGVATSFPFMNLIVGHLGGSLTIADRVNGDHTKGAKIILTLPMASEREQ